MLGLGIRDGMFGRARGSLGHHFVGNDDHHGLIVFGGTQAGQEALTHALTLRRTPDGALRGYPHAIIIGGGAAARSRDGWSWRDQRYLDGIEWRARSTIVL